MFTKKYHRIRKPRPFFRKLKEFYRETKSDFIKFIQKTRMNFIFKFRPKKTYQLVYDIMSERFSKVLSVSQSNICKGDASGRLKYGDDTSVKGKYYHYSNRETETLQKSERDTFWESKKEDNSNIPVSRYLEETNKIIAKGNKLREKETELLNETSGKSMHDSLTNPE